MEAPSRPDRRANQKARTRSAIVEAAVTLIQVGGQPTVAEAAAAAKVSRATAYRYFPTQESLHLEAASLTPMAAEIDRLLDEAGDADVAARLDLLVGAATSLFQREEATMRTALRSYLDMWFDARRHGEVTQPAREGRRRRWIERAVGEATKRLDPVAQRRLKAALALTIGIEPLIVMKDVCALGDAEARDVLHWASRALLQQALVDSGSASRPKSK